MTEVYKEPYQATIDQPVILPSLAEYIWEKFEYFDKRANEYTNDCQWEKEAKKAVEKFKALTRLRKKGFKFTGFSEGSIHFKLDKEYSEFTYNGYDEGCEFYVNRDVNGDLETLFGVEL